MIIGLLTCSGMHQLEAASSKAYSLLCTQTAFAVTKYLKRCYLRMGLLWLMVEEYSLSRRGRQGNRNLRLHACVRTGQEAETGWDRKHGQLIHLEVPRDLLPLAMLYFLKVLQNSATILESSVQTHKPLGGMQI